MDTSLLRTYTSILYGIAGCTWKEKTKTECDWAKTELVCFHWLNFFFFAYVLQFVCCLHFHWSNIITIIPLGSEYLSESEWNLAQYNHIMRIILHNTILSVTYFEMKVLIGYCIPLKQKIAKKEEKGKKEEKKKSQF